MSDELMEMLVGREIPPYGLKAVGDQFLCPGNLAAQLKISGYARKVRQKRAVTGGTDKPMASSSTKSNKPAPVTAPGGGKLTPVKEE